MSIEKVEGAIMVCKNCGTELVCHEKTYPASDGHPEKKVMQWQNPDGSAHYSTKDGKNFKCVDKDKNEITEKKPIPQNDVLDDIPNIESYTMDTVDISKNIITQNSFELEFTEEKVTLESLNEKLDHLKEILVPIFHWVVDEQLKEESRKR